MKTTNPALAVQANTRAGFFERGIYYQFKDGFIAGMDDAYESGAIFNFGYIRNQTQLSYIASKIRVEPSNVVIQTYSLLNIKNKSKIKLGDKIFQVKTYDEDVTVISPFSKLIKYTLVLG